MAKSDVQSDSEHTLSKADYDSAYATREALRQEIVFILEEMISVNGIKIHMIESRVKAFDSLRKKLEDRAGGSPSDIHDIVGARIICLFKSDLTRIGALIEQEFSILETDDKIEVSTDSFGYMSVHYICTMKGEYEGPRYNKIKGMSFEIQVRTLCMHAWAAISHYLDYKAEWDIPAHLRKGLNALSGLFYVADEQYEHLYDARQESRVQAGQQTGTSSKPTPINLDTLTAFLARKYSERAQPRSERASVLVRELVEAGYTTLEEVDRDLESSKAALAKREGSVKKQQKVKTPLFYNSMGAVRASLSETNSRFKEAFNRSPPPSDEELAEELDDEE